MASELPTVRWGIIGMISEWFINDILRPAWPNKRANHKVQAIGSSSLHKGETFVQKHMSGHPVPSIYGDYTSVYNDPDVDVVYIGTPHSLHKRNCLDAIAAGKHVLCEKPFVLNLDEAEEVFSAARQKGVFVTEGMWTRFFPLVIKLQSLLHEEKAIGEVHRTFADFGLDIDISKLPKDSRYKDPALGAGSLLDVGVYSLTWGIVSLCGKVGEAAEDPEVVSAQSLQHGVDTTSSFIIRYPSTGRQGILTSTTNVVGRQPFARIEGSKGVIEIEGMPSGPDSFTLTLHGEKQGKKFEFDKPGKGFYWEADAVAWDLKEGRQQNQIMPWTETERVMGILDGIRRRSGARFPVDGW